MWFFTRNRRNLAKLETKVAELEDKLNQQYQEHESISDAINLMCKDLRDFLTDENNFTEYDIQTKQNNTKTTGQDRKA